MKTVRGKEMVTLEERLRRDMLFYESVEKDEQRIPSNSVRYDFGRVKDAIKEVGSQLKDVGQAAKGKKRSGRKPKK